ncbi:hypothetical protein [Micromonospora sp. NBC_01699]|uniref:hypothetical protein n=1 Tax=Micromonospora sp. NBC_01699 TaxID=2975984 RepID=UPI003FA55902
MAAAAVVYVTAAAVPAYAIDHGKGKPGFCTSGSGVTVVVDFQQLGGTTIVRCFPQSSRGTGLDALKGAGFQIAGAQRWGEAFVCRVENRPSAVEQVPISGNPDYREACVDTPPAKAYWSYWHAGNNCPWQYSQWGVKNRDFVQGGFEGWSFSLNATAASNPVPRIAAVRPGTEGRACNASEEPPPISDDPDEQRPPRPDPPAPPGNGNPAGGTDDGNPGGGDGDGGRAPNTGGAPPAPTTSGTALPPPRPQATATGTVAAASPAENVAFSGGERAEDVNEVIRRQSGASRWAPWAALGAIVVLVVTTWWTARRRSRKA